MEKKRRKNIVIRLVRISINIKHFLFLFFFVVATLVFPDLCKKAQHNANAMKAEKKREDVKNKKNGRT